MVNYCVKRPLRLPKHFFRILLFASALFRLPNAYAQKIDTVKLFYNINEAGLSAENKLKLRALNNTLSNTDSVFVSGFTDYLADKRYNFILSAKRADAIKEFLLGFQKDLNVTTSGKGAVARSGIRSSLGEPQNRRVDILVIRKPRLTTRRPAEAGRYQASRLAAAKPDYKAFNSKINDLENLKPGGSISLEELTFQAGRHYLNPDRLGYLDRLLKYFKEHNALSFQIVGHTCCDIEKRDAVDLDTHTRYLSVNRARYIFEYFIANGIDRGRMSYTGVGSSKPKIWPELNEDDQYLNRRVEIIITRN